MPSPWQRNWACCKVALACKGVSDRESDDCAGDAVRLGLVRSPPWPDDRKSLLNAMCKRRLKHTTAIPRLCSMAIA